MKAVVTFERDGAEQIIETEKGTLLSEVLNRPESSRHIDMPCAGKGRCGGCAVYIDGVKRLACQTAVQNDMHIKLIDSPGFNAIAADKISVVPVNPMYRRYGIAVDIGTTTVCMALLDASGAIETAIRKNPQTAFGADVISRVEKALSGHSTELAGSIRTALNEMTNELCERKGILAGEIDAAVITGNTTMLYLLTGHDPKPLSHAPFYADRLFGESIDAESLGLLIALDAQVYIPPCISAFVGADITTAIIASGMCDLYKTAILTDIGTNGEMALWHKGKLTCCSTAAGPAFEGAGISHGTYGTNGAIDKAWVSNGRILTSTIGGEPAVGICGSGAIDILAALLKTGIVSEAGAFEDKLDFFELQNGVKVTASDIRKIQLAKGAIRAGIETLLETVGVCKKDIEALCISGSFGGFINLKNAAAIGLIPVELLERAQVVGNASNNGAVMLLRDNSLCTAAQSIAEHADVLALDANPVFTDFYMEHMTFEQIENEASH